MERILSYSVSRVLDKFNIPFTAVKELFSNYDLKIDLTAKGGNNVELDKADRLMKESERQKSGSFYTGMEVADFLVEYSLSDYKSANGKHFDPLKSSFIEPSCGSGNIAVSYLEHFLNNGIIKSDEELSVVLGNITLIDSHQSALAITICRILLLYSEFPQKLNLDVKCMDFLDFDAANKYELSIQNPPYIGEKSNKQLFRNTRGKDFGREYYESKMDYFYFFIYKTSMIMSETGTATFLTSNYFVTADGASKFRGFLRSTFILFSYKDGFEKNLFPTLGVHNAIYTLSKEDHETVRIMTNGESYSIPRGRVFSKDGYISIVNKKEYYAVLDKIESQSNFTLSDFVEIRQGLVSGLDKGAFVLEDNDEVVSDNIKTLYKNSNIDKYFIFEKRFEKRVLYITEGTSISLNELQWLEKSKERLSKRREVEKGYRKWYELTWPRDKKVFEGIKIVAPQRSILNTFALSTAEFYASADVYYIHPGKDIDKAMLFHLLGYLNSSVVYFYLHCRGKRKGDLLELYSTPLSKIPIPSGIFLAGLVEEMLLEGRYNDDIQKKINMMVYERLDLSEDQIITIEKLMEGVR